MRHSELSQKRFLIEDMERVDLDSIGVSEVNIETTGDDTS